MILLIGNGYVGSAVTEELLRRNAPFVVADSRSNLRELINASDAVINAAGYTGRPNVDACESDKAACVAGNVMLPARISEMIEDRPWVHVSSGCVYSGNHEYTEAERPNFDKSFYSASKILGERAAAGARIVRIRMPFSLDNNPRCLVTKLKGYKKILDGGPNSISYLPDVARACVDLLAAPVGIYHVACPDPITNREIADYLGLRREYWGWEEYAAQGFAPRSFCTLSVRKASDYVKLSSAHELIKGAR